MKILLVNPPVDYHVPVYFQSESLGLGYIASVLRRDGFEVEILDAQLQGFDVKRTISEILAKNFDCLGITAAHAHKKVLPFIAKAVRSKRKDVLIIVGGYLPSLSTEQLLPACPEIDFAIRGEGEISTPDIFRRIAQGKDWHDAPGVAFMDGNSPVLNPLPPLVQDMDSLPFPARDALMNAPSHMSPRIAGSRGCYHRCSFCCIQSFYALSGKHTPRFRSAQNIVNEIESIIALTGRKEIRFIDDDFIGPGAKSKERVISIAKEIRGRKLGINFAIECRPDEVDEDILKLLKEVGLTEVFLGVESGVQRQLDTYNKRTTVEQNKLAIEMVRRCGLKLRSGFIMFDPYMTVADLVQNMEFLNETGIADETRKISPVQFLSKVHVYPGVPLVEQLQKDGLLREKGIDVDYVFKDPWMRVIFNFLGVLGVCSEFFLCLRRRT